jgi:prepilin-type processing-associated H-X9-DG protein
MVEMLVVMGICATLAAILVPVLFRCRANARAVVCASHLKGMGQALAVCTTQANGTLPETYYSFQGHDGIYGVLLRNPQTVHPDVLFLDDTHQVLACPSDETPVSITTQTQAGKVSVVPCSYGYNVALPLMFRNAARLQNAVNTVTFYDGDLSAAVGKTWQSSCPHWAVDTIRYRHLNEANFLFVDGHVERLGAFPEADFLGYEQWLGSSLDARPAGGGGCTIEGRVNVNPGDDFEFSMRLPNGTTLRADDLRNNTSFTGPGFIPGGKLEYRGPVARLEVKPKGNGNQNGLKVSNVTLVLDNATRYTITSDAMNVHLYNDHASGKAMGKWWIEIDAMNATLNAVL